MKRQSIFVLTILTVVLITNIARADLIGYNITDLGTLGGDSSMAMGINSYGQVVGQSQTASGEQQPFLWQGGTMTPLTNVGFTSGGALSINDSGVIVGTSTGTGTPTASVWTGGARSSLDTGSYQEGRAYNVNDSGEVVGEVSSYDEAPHLIDRQAVLWKDGTMTELGDFGLGFSYTRGINDSGQIVGTAYSSSEDGVAFLWEDGQMTDLGALLDNDKTKSAAHDINNSGQVVGHSATTIDSNGDPSVYHAFLWDNGVMSDLGVLAGGYSYANAINDLGQAVGYSGGPSYKAVLWDSDGNIFDLNDWLSSGSNWNLIYAFDINNNGQIVGYGSFNGEYHGYLLNPDGSFPAEVVPVPSAVILGSIGLTFSGWLLRKRKML